MRSNAAVSYERSRKGNERQETAVAGVLRDYELDMQRRGLTRRSVVQLTGQVRAFQRHLWERGKDLDSASEDDLQRFLDGRSISSKTRAGWLSALHGYYVFANRTGRALSDPTANIIRPKVPRTLPRPLTDSDLHMAVGQASPMMRAWIMLAAFAGLRCMEIANLRIEDIYWDSALLRVQGKGQKERMVPLHLDAAKAIRDAGLPRKGHLFLRPRGGPYQANHISAEGSTFFKLLGIPGGLHGARHWYATKTLDACGNLRTVQVLLGHASPETTAIYTAFSQRDARAAVDTLTL